MIFTTQLKLVLWYVMCTYIIFHTHVHVHYFMHPFNANMQDRKAFGTHIYTSQWLLQPGPYLQLLGGAVVHSAAPKVQRCPRLEGQVYRHRRACHCHLQSSCKGRGSDATVHGTHFIATLCLCTPTQCTCTCSQSL